MWPPRGRRDGLPLHLHRGRGGQGILLHKIITYKILKCVRTFTVRTCIQHHFSYMYVNFCSTELSNWMGGVPYE